MAFWDRHPRMYQLAFGLLTALLFGIGILNLYRYTEMGTDENLYADPPSPYYVTESIPGTLLLSGNLSGVEQVQPREQDSIVLGDLILAINGVRPDSGEHIYTILRDAVDHNFLEFDVFRLSEALEMRFKVRIKDIPSDFFYSLPPTACVFEVLPGGVSDRAGIVPGDLIIRVNGQSFNSIFEADRMMREARAGTTIRYDIIRANRIIAVEVTLATFGISFALMVMFLSGFVFMLVGAMIGFLRPEIKPARLVGMALLLVGFVLCTLFIRLDHVSNVFSQIRNSAIIFALFFGLSVWFHSAYYFPREKTELLKTRWRTLVPYFISGITLLLGFVLSLVFEVVAETVVLFGGLVVLLVYHIVLDIVDRKARNDEYRIADTILGYATYSAAILTTIAVTALGYTGYEAYIGYVGFLWLCIPFIYLYVIGRFRLLDLNVRLRRNTQYTLLSMLWGVVVVTFIILGIGWLASLKFNLPNIRFSGAFIEIVRERPTIQEQLFLSSLIKSVLSVGLVLIVWQLRGQVQLLIDEKFYRQRHDYRQAGSELTEILGAKLSALELARELVFRLGRLMHLKNVGVMLLRENSVYCYEAYGFDADEWKSACADIEAELVRSIRKFHGEFNVDYLPDQVKKQLRPFSFQYIIPIRSEEMTVGALFVGEKLAENTLSWDELAFLNSVARQAAVTIENVVLYEELAEQERLKHELAIARRIQLESLPQSTPIVSGLDIAGISIPALEVGGDFFDYLTEDEDRENITLIIGDVSGKGTHAALYMSKVQGILRSLNGFIRSPRELLIQTNQLLSRDLSRESFVTALGARFDTGGQSVSVARAGHAPLLHYCGATGQTEAIQPKGIGLGLLRSTTFNSRLQEEHVRYQPGDIFLFYTDGITEAQAGQQQEFDEEDLKTIIATYASNNAHYIRDKIITHVQSLSNGGEQHDDQTLVVVKAMG